LINLTSFDDLSAVLPRSYLLKNPVRNIRSTQYILDNENNLTRTPKENMLVIITYTYPRFITINILFCSNFSSKHVYIPSIHYYTSARFRCTHQSASLYEPWSFITGLPSRLPRVFFFSRNLSSILALMVPGSLQPHTTGGRPAGTSSCICCTNLVVPK
jgi:hypothetical protein